MLSKKYKNNPIIVPDGKNSFEKECTYNPCVIIHKGKIYLIYRAEGKRGDYVSRLCLAVSNDGYNFRKYRNNPIIEPTLSEEKRGCEDPRITKINNIFYLTYVSWNGKKVNISLATSNDLINWEKHGMIIKNYKSGALYNKQIDGKYIMFFGDKNIQIAHSKNLKEWSIDKNPVLKPRRDMFDGLIVEPGPAPFLLKDKLVFIYNSANRHLVYQPSFVILDANNPHKIVYRAKKPLLVPSERFELFGKVNNVIFVEGLVEFKNTYFLYYGGGDKCIGVATIKKRKLEEYISNEVPHV